MAQPAHGTRSDFGLQYCLLFLLAAQGAGKVPSEAKESPLHRSTEDREGLFLSSQRNDRRECVGEKGMGMNGCIQSSRRGLLRCVG